METKKCTKCEETKALSEFHFHPGGLHKKASRCRSCIKEYRAENKERIQKHREEHRQENTDYARKYREENSAKIAATRKKAQAHKKPEARDKKSAYGKANRPKTRATHNLNYAIRTGKITRGHSCETCKKTEGIEGHHWSYLPEHQLDVIWLCKKCHQRLHFAQKAEAKQTEETL